MTAKQKPFIVWDHTTKVDLIDAIYGEDSRKVDTAIPREYWESCDSRWAVTDYTGEGIFGRVVDLRTKAREKGIQLVGVIHPPDEYDDNVYLLLVERLN